MSREIKKTNALRRPLLWRRACFCAVALALAVAAVFALRGTAPDGSSDARATVQRQIREKVREKGRRNVRPGARARTKPVRERDEAGKAEDSDRPFSAADQEIVEVADDVVSDHDFATAQDVAAAALRSKDARVRLRAVEALTDFGEEGVPELADFLKDPDDEVAKLAAMRFEIAIQEIEDDEERILAAKLGLLTVDDKDEVLSLMGVLQMSNDKPLVIEALADVIRDGGAVQVEAAKEAYQEETGEDWSGIEAAEAWLRENQDGE